MITETKNIAELDTETLKEIQFLLDKAGFPEVGAIDGIWGINTKRAWTAFKVSIRQGSFPLIGESSYGELVKAANKPKSSLLVTWDQAAAIFTPKYLTTEKLASLNECLIRFEINTKPRIRHFLSQIAHESGELHWTAEIASGADYEGRRDLGNIYPGDGQKYKGVDFLQMTGRSNYQSFSLFIGDPKVMKGWKYVQDNYMFLPSGYWWYRNKMNDLCDRGGSVEQVTKRVNGGYNGLADRQHYYEKALRAIP